MRPIDADALIEFIDMGHLRNPLESCFSERDVVDMLESQPTIEQGKWIPVAERLPVETGYYFVCHKGGLVAERYFYSDAPELFIPFGNEPVTHWMPLPMPPKGDE